MAYMLLVAHLLGDYLFQFDFIARWKARSLMGVVAHGAIVTLTTLLCSLLVDPSWWPYAVLIGAVHTIIDVVRARLIHVTHPTAALLWYLFDQAVHVVIIFLVVGWTRAPSAPSFEHAVARVLAPDFLAYLIGYLLLLQPAWVLLRFIVRGVWGGDAAPDLSAGEKYGPMLERVLITTSVLSGQFYLVPLVLLPRRIKGVQIQGNGVGMLVQLTSHWAETFLGVLLAVGIGLALRIVAIGY